MSTTHPSSERNMATGERHSKQPQTAIHAGTTPGQPQHSHRGLTEAPPDETEDGGEQILSGQPREEGGERDL